MVDVNPYAIGDIVAFSMDGTEVARHGPGLCVGQLSVLNYRRPDTRHPDASPRPV